MATVFGDEDTLWSDMDELAKTRCDEDLASWEVAVVDDDKDAVEEIWSDMDELAENK